jgi:hypothetical protein
MNLRFVISAIFVCMLMVCAVTTISAQTFDISSGGQPTITGALGGSVTGSSSVLSNLVVTINFGEVSPANTNSIVKVVVPIAIRSTQPYQVSVSLAGSGNANPQGLQPSDIGFGAANIRAMGNQSQVCTLSSHIFYPPFNNDPASTVTIAANGRVTYQSSLSNITGATVILSGPRLQKSNNPVRQANDGYIFDAIFAITPQFFAAGTSSATLTFSISAGPNVPC